MYFYFNHAHWCIHNFHKTKKLTKTIFSFLSNSSLRLGVDFIFSLDNNSKNKKSPHLNFLKKGNNYHWCCSQSPYFNLYLTSLNIIGMSVYKYPLSTIFPWVHLIWNLPLHLIYLKRCKSSIHNLEFSYNLEREREGEGRKKDRV